MNRKVLTMMLLLGWVLSGCAAVTKRTDFYKDGKIVKTFFGHGVWDANEYLGSYKIWAMHGWNYYEYTCDKCQVVETPLEQK